ncbi:molybdenum ABC transporter ATP-binding protein [Opitutales bacterium ASA1]|uniref:molybdenum ABC transporter ATP-binding protein n=1 Tax=Congregicoccus parvus TaxID=3081749 RepID=UPI002B2F94C0|nr:molybdenum ABC transporter ATP-binding protein [Opitutales bacterium ASA1]
MSDGQPIEAITVRLRVDRGAFALDVDLALPGRGVSALFGPSGSGKTTILRSVAGLERGARGVVAVGEAIWQDSARDVFLPPHARAIGYVFQEANLFPHLSVRDNLLYGRRRAGKRGAERPVDLEQMIELLGIGGLLHRSPEHLSGGERQRVAIARALAASPRLLLLDEPLASLDLDRKRELLPYLERLHEELEIPVILVSHALDEVVRLADHLTLVRAGRVVASGWLAETLARVDLPEVASQDAGVVLDGTVVGADPAYGLVEVEISEMRLQVVHVPTAIGQKLRLQVQSRDVSLALEKPRDTSVLNLLPARVVSAHADETRAHVHVVLAVGGTSLVARITRLSRDRLRLEPGASVWAQIKAVAVVA